MPGNIPGSTVNTTTPAPSGSVYDTLSSKASSLGLNERDMAGLDPGLLMEAAYSKGDLANMPEYAATTAGQLSKSRETLSNTPMPSASLLRPLENALKTKESIGQQEMGTSELFGQAGLTGYSVLSQSLGERSREMDDTYRSFSSMMETTSTALGDAYNQTKETYGILKDEYDTQMAQFQGTLDRIQDAEDAMKMLQQEDQMERDMYAYKARIDAEYAGNSEGSQNEGLGDIDYSSAWDDPDVTNQLGGLFHIDKMSKYAESGWGSGQLQCAEGSNLITTGHLGSKYSDKMSKVVKRDDAQMGNQLVIPYGPVEWGHAATILHSDPETGAIFTQEWNHNGDGKMTFETYNINDLNDKYGSNWGMTDSQLNPEYQQAAQQAIAGMGQPPQMNVPQGAQDIASYSENKQGMPSPMKTAMESAMPTVSGVMDMASGAMKTYISKKKAEFQAELEASNLPEEEKVQKSKQIDELTNQVADYVAKYKERTGSKPTASMIDDFYEQLMVEAGLTELEESTSSGSKQKITNIDEMEDPFEV